MNIGEGMSQVGGGIGRDAANIHANPVIVVYRCESLSASAEAVEKLQPFSRT